MITKVDALLKLKPDAEWTWRGDDYDGLKWLDQNQTKPTEQEILDKQTELQTEYDNNQYQRDRANDYPPIEEQLDMQYWDKINGTNNWETMIAEIKARYPK
tara:strand:+ start:536 stop:838 length:303 start_codon:yes stop_codon:yes gene_type:complete